MLAGRPLTELGRQKARLRTRICIRRRAWNTAAATLLTPLRWIEWGVGMLRAGRQTWERGDEQGP